MLGQPSVLKYAVHKFSSYSANYIPGKILEDKPTDQSSRWSSETNSPPQFLVLKLERPAVLYSIKFGKYEKIHVCNIKKFRVYGGLTEDSLLEILEGGLKNDHIPELFGVRNKIDDRYFPCRYVKIMPLQSWGPTFNFSIWHVELRGCDDPLLVSPYIDWYHTYREREAVRLCLKHLRQHRYLDAYGALQKRTKVQLEHPVLTSLHKRLVLEGDFEACEQLVEKACCDGHFNQFICDQAYVPEWVALQPASSAISGEVVRPGMRGGHQMSIDSYSEMIYLHGGWDGYKDLADMWSFHIPSRRWTKLCDNTEAEGGPSARSCHKMVIDTDRKLIYCIGRYVENTNRTRDNLKSDFYVYDISAEVWTLISEDTGACSGPKLIFDHQLAFNAKDQILYCFGGRILTCTDEAPRYLERSFSGLYACHVPTNTWTTVRDDSPPLRARTAHSMLFHPHQRALYVFAGQRLKESLTDLISYRVDTGEITLINDGARKDATHAPVAGFTQRATLDPETNEIHVLKGIGKDRDRTEKKDTVRNALWVYNLAHNKWSCVYENSPGKESDVTKPQSEPVPRFAHQLVYDHVKKVHYLFGGNPGKDTLPKVRLDDFWALKLQRPSTQQLVRRCRFLLRRQKFYELVRYSPEAAVLYLQTALHDTVDHTDPAETREFQLLAGSLFTQAPEDSRSRSLNTDPEYNANYKQRTDLYDQLVAYFPESMTQPRKNLTDLIPLQ